MADLDLPGSMIKYFMNVAEVAERHNRSCLEVLTRGLELYDAEQTDIAKAHGLSLPRVGRVSTELARTIRKQLNSHFAREAIQQLSKAEREARAKKMGTARWEKERKAKAENVD